MRILIYNTMLLKNIGGPSGYLYNLKKYLDNKKKLIFLKERIFEIKKIKIINF